MQLTNVTALLPAALWAYLPTGLSSPAQSLLRLATSIDNTTSLCPGRPATTAQQKAILNSFLHTFFVEQDARAAFERHVADDYIQHNPDVEQGKMGPLELMQPLIDAGLEIEILRTVVADNYAVVHMRSQEGGREQPLAVIDIYRFDGTCIVEHWDVIQERPANSKNPLAMF